MKLAWIILAVIVALIIIVAVAINYLFSMWNDVTVDLFSSQPSELPDESNCHVRYETADKIMQERNNEEQIFMN